MLGNVTVVGLGETGNLGDRGVGTGDGNRLLTIGLVGTEGAPILPASGSLVFDLMDSAVVAVENFLACPYRSGVLLLFVKVWLLCCGTARDSLEEAIIGE